VEQIELGTGKVIARFASQMAAGRAMSAKGKSGGIAIGDCARGRSSKAYGFGWRHAVVDGDEPEEKEDDDADDDDNDDDDAPQLQPLPLPPPLHQPAPQPQPDPRPQAAAGARRHVVSPADREATRLRIFDTMTARYRRYQQPSEAALSSIAAMAADREIHVYSTRASDAAYLAMDDATLLRRADQVIR